jgi:hypothetical protein
VTIKNFKITYKTLLKTVYLEITVTDEPLYKVIGKIDIPLINMVKYLNVSINILIIPINFSVRLE